jgi:hypothetical protein
MPRFLDVHSFHSLGESTVKELQCSPSDEFGVKYLNILYNKAKQSKRIVFLLSKGSDRESVENHHERANLKFAWITEVETTA